MPQPTTPDRSGPADRDTVDEFKYRLDTTYDEELVQLERRWYSKNLTAQSNSMSPFLSPMKTNNRDAPSIQIISFLDSPPLDQNQSQELTIQTNASSYVSEPGVTKGTLSFDMNNKLSQASTTVECSEVTPNISCMETSPTRTVGRTMETVFDRLYKKGKARVSAARLRELEELRESRSACSFSSSLGGTPQYTPSTGSVFERLYRNEKRTSPPKKSIFFKSLVPVSPLSASALERRKIYSESIEKKRLTFNKTLVTIKCGSDTSQGSSGRSTASKEDSVFERLYRRKKRPTASLLPAGFYLSPTSPRSLPERTTSSSKKKHNLFRKHVSSDHLITPKRKLSFESCIPPLIIEDSPSESSFGAPSIRRVVRNVQYDEDARSRSAVLIQKTWRMHRAEIMITDQLLVGWWIHCDYQSPVDYNKVIVLKMGLESLIKAIQKVDESTYAMDVEADKNCLLFEWTKDVVVDVEIDGVSIVEEVSICFKCSMSRIKLTMRWSSHKTASLVFKATVDRLLKRDEDKFLNACATIIQRWVRPHLTCRRRRNV